MAHTAGVAHDTHGGKLAVWRASDGQGKPRGLRQVSRFQWHLRSFPATAARPQAEGRTE